jgi:hypothetical protein
VAVVYLKRLFKERRDTARPKNKFVMKYRYQITAKEIAMITTLVQFRLPEPITAEKAKEIFLSTAPKYTSVPGLLRKHYLITEDGLNAGGVYLWKSRADAERLFTDDWRKFVVDKYGSEPVINWFVTPVVVDNGAGKIITGEE